MIALLIFIFIILAAIMMCCVSNTKIGNFFDRFKNNFKSSYVFLMFILLIAQVIILFFYGYELANKLNLILTNYIGDKDVAGVVFIFILIIYFLIVMCFYIIENKLEEGNNSEDKLLSLVDLLSAFFFNISIVFLFGKLIVEVNEGRKALIVFLTIIMAVLASNLISIFIERIYSIAKSFGIDFISKIKKKKEFMLLLILLFVSLMSIYIYMNFDNFSLLETGSLLWGAVLSTLLTYYFKCNEGEPNKGELNKDDNKKTT